MKVGRKPPEERSLLVKTKEGKKGKNPSDHEYDLYQITPHVVAKLKWDGKLSWYTPDGMRFQGAQSAIDYVVKDIERKGEVLDPGRRYYFEYEEVLDQGDRLILKNAAGESLIIRSGKEL